MNSSTLMSVMRRLRGASFTFSNLVNAALMNDATLSSDPKHEQKILEILLELEASESIRLPSRKRKGNWIIRGEVEIPRWIRLHLNKQDKKVNLLSAKRIAWTPKMRWAIDLKPAQLELAIPLNDFFKQGGPHQEMSINERSLQIYGNEKVIKDRLLGSTWFKKHLTLDDLGCYDYPSPIAYELFDNGTQRAIVLENQDTYHTFKRWNKEAHQYSAILYGIGNSFASCVMNLPEIPEGYLPDDGIIEYFGDIDAEGFNIPTRAQEAIDRNGLNFVLAPAMRFYELTLEYGDLQDHTTKKVLSDAAVDWMPEQLRDQIEALIFDEFRVPQEVVNFEVLCELSGLEG